MGKTNNEVKNNSQDPKKAKGLLQRVLQRVWKALGFLAGIKIGVPPVGVNPNKSQKLYNRHVVQPQEESEISQQGPNLQNQTQDLHNTQAVQPQEEWEISQQSPKPQEQTRGASEISQQDPKPQEQTQKLHNTQAVQPKEGSEILKYAQKKINELLQSAWKALGSLASSKTEVSVTKQKSKNQQYDGGVVARPQDAQDVVSPKVQPQASNTMKQSHVSRIKSKSAMTDQQQPQGRK